MLTLPSPPSVAGRPRLRLWQRHSSKWLTAALCVAMSLTNARSTAATNAQPPVDTEVGGGSDMMTDAGVSVGGGERDSGQNQGQEVLGIHISFSSPTTLSQVHRQRLAAAVQLDVLARVEKLDGAALDEAVEAILDDRAGLAVVFTAGSVSGETVDAVVENINTNPVVIRLTRQNEFVSTGAKILDALSARTLVTENSGRRVKVPVRVKRQSGLVTTTTNAPLVSGGTIAVSFSVDQASAVDQAIFLAAVRQRALDNGATLLSADVVASPTEVVVTAVFPSTESASAISGVATAMDPQTAPISVVLPSGRTVDPTIVVVTLPDGTVLSLTLAPTPPTPPVALSCGGVVDADVCATLVGGLGCIGVVPQICPASCGACSNGANPTTAAPMSAAPTAEPTSPAPSTSALPTTCFGAADPLTCANSDCSIDTVTLSCPARCNSCYHCNSIPDSVVCRLSFADCDTAGIPPICPGKCGQPQCTAAIESPTTGPAAPTAVGATPDSNDACFAADPNSVTSASNPSYCTCRTGYLDAAKPTNSRIHIKAIGTYNVGRGCTHLCGAAQPASALCYCASHPGTAGCTTVNSAVTSAPITVSPPTAGSTSAISPTSAPATSPTAFSSDSCSVLDSHSRVSASNSNYCDCLPGYVDGAKPSNDRIHRNSIGSFNAGRGCNHICTPSSPSSQICFCASNPVGSGCT